MKKIISLIICLIMIVSVFGGCMVQKKDGVALTVGDVEMSASEFAYYIYMCKVQLAQEQGVTLTDEAAEKEFLDTKNGDVTNRQVICDNAVKEAEKLLVQYNKAVEMGLELTEDDSARCVNDITSMKTQMGGAEAYEQQLAQLGTTPRAFEELYKKNIVASKLFDKLSTDGTLEVTDEQTSEYIKNNYVKAAHILFSMMDTSTNEMYDEATIASKKQLAEDTLKKINDGEDFNKLMNELSEDPGLETSPDGYVFTKGEMVPEFEETAFGLEENKVSGVVETSYGYHIIKRLPLEVNEELIAQYGPSAKTMCQADKLDELTEGWKKDFKTSLNEKEIKNFK